MAPSHESAFRKGAAKRWQGQGRVGLAIELRNHLIWVAGLVTWEECHTVHSANSSSAPDPRCPRTGAWNYGVKSSLVIKLYWLCSIIFNLHNLHRLRTTRPRNNLIYPPCRFIKNSIVIRVLNNSAGHFYAFFIAEHIQFHINGNPINSVGGKAWIVNCISSLLLYIR